MSQHFKFRHGCGTLLVLTIWLILFWPLLTGFEEFAFRDSASLYQPLFEWTRDQWLAGQVPLWCPLDNWGAPVVADATSGVFYPGKLIFLLRFIPFPVLFGLFTAGHVLLAVFATRWCAARFGMSPAAGWLSAIAFGFGGAVLFQTCNVIYLVGAAWLPLALGNIWRFGQRGDWKSAVHLSLVMALMVLAGDPQMAFHVGLIAGVWWFSQGLVGQRSTRPLADLVWPTGAWAGVLVLAIGLSAVQTFPGIEWAAESERTITSVPDPPWLATGRPVPGTHRDAIYQFSMPPWNLCEMVWPHLFGKLDFASGWRWSSSLAGSDRVWSGSIYCGVIVFLLALVAIFGAGKRRADYLLLGMLVLFLSGSFGWYGIGWLVNELQLMRGGGGFGPWLGEPTGGVYWLLEQLVPGYASFRYPAKLFVVASLAICLLGGRGLDRVLGGAPGGQRAAVRRLARLVRATLGCSVLLAGAVLLNAKYQSAALQVLDATASRQVLVAVAHVMVVLSCFAGLLLLARRGRIRVRHCLVATLLLCSLDLLVAVRWTISTVPVNDRAARGPLAVSLDRFRATYRPSRDGWGHYSRDPLEVQLDMDRQTLMPKHHLPAGQRLIGSFNSIQPLELTCLLQLLDGMDSRQRDRLLPLWSVDSRIDFGEAGRETPRQARLHPLEGRERFYLATAIERWPGVDPRSFGDIEQVTRDLLERFDRSGERLPAGVIVESDESVLRGVQAADPTARVHLVEETLCRIRLAVESPGRHLLVAADYHDRNWVAFRVDDHGARTSLPMVRVNRLLRGVVVPPGNYEVEMVYRPWSFRAGALTSCLAWSLVAFWWLFRRWRVRRR